jgi:uncharacterized protein
LEESNRGEALHPILPNERIITLDIIRGFAIFGIFLVNMLDFHSPWQYVNMAEWWPLPADRATEIFINIFAQASFYTLFSFLFGYGLMILKERAELKGYTARGLFFRRLLALLGIGVVHAFLIWSGDILISYAIIGVIFFLFLHTKPKTKLVWGIVLIGVPTLLVAGLLFLVSLLDPENMSKGFYDLDKAHDALEAYGSGNYADIFSQRIQDWWDINNFANFPFLILALLPMFLLGAYASQIKILEQVESKLISLKKVCLWTGVFGFTIKIFPYMVNPDNISLLYIQDSLGGPLLAIFYFTGITLLCRHRAVTQFLKPLSFVGRLSLSNYLFQSIVCTLIFYNYGLGLYGEVRPIYGLGLNIVIFALQIYLSKRWLQSFQFGPAEWVWRFFTYGKRQPLRRE